ncbi:MAG: hypothetical protein RL154_1126 [Pseudomonadota bacterium]|jgi:DNA-binding response OmpR family regulator
MYRVLLLEDDFLLLTSIKSYLNEKGFQITDFENGQTALKAVKTQTFDIYILDINTPGIRGLDVLKYIRQKKLATPVIIISANHDIGYIERAYGLGCNEYLKKPFSLRELEIRIKNLLAPSKVLVDQNFIKLSDTYSYNLQNDSLTFNDKPVKLPRKQHFFIKLLVKNIGHIVSQEEICKFIWGDALVDDSTIRSLVNRTRELLDEPLIETHKGLGYKMSLVK